MVYWLGNGYKQLEQGKVRGIGHFVVVLLQDKEDTTFGSDQGSILEELVVEVVEDDSGGPKVDHF